MKTKKNLNEMTLSAYKRLLNINEDTPYLALKSRVLGMIMTGELPNSAIDKLDGCYNGNDEWVGTSHIYIF